MPYGAVSFRFEPGGLMPCDIVSSGSMPYAPVSHDILPGDPDPYDSASYETLPRRITNMAAYCATIVAAAAAAAIATTIPTIPAICNGVVTPLDALRRDAPSPCTLVDPAASFEPSDASVTSNAHQVSRQDAHTEIAAGSIRQSRLPCSSRSIFAAVMMRSPADAASPRSWGRFR